MASRMHSPYRDVLSLRELMDQMVTGPMLRPSQAAGTDTSLFMPVDVQISDHDYLMRVNVPGLKPEDVHVDIVGNRVNIRGESRHDDQEADGDYLLQEWTVGRVTRTLMLPTELDSSACEADVEDGVLTLRIPKAEAARPRSIAVRTRSQSDDSGGEQNRARPSLWAGRAGEERAEDPHAGSSGSDAQGDEGEETPSGRSSRRRGRGASMGADASSNPESEGSAGF